MGVLRQIVALMAGLAVLLLAPPALAGPAALSGAGVAATAMAADANVGALDCCDDHDPGSPGFGDCRPGMACHASPPAVTPPEAGPGEPIATRISYVLTSDHLVDSRPPEGILRPPRALAS